MTIGADVLCDVLLANGVDHCFANPGTSEMHFVAALDRNPNLRCVLGLFEGVVTGAADGYGRMADKPAATLLHVGPGLANGLANLHNAKRGRTPLLNIVGDHSSGHLKWDAPLTSDIESLARPMSGWVGRVSGPWDVRARTEEAIASAVRTRNVSTLVLPADAAWGRVDGGPVAAVALPDPPGATSDLIEAAASALNGGGKCAIFLSGLALREGALATAGKIAVKTGAVLYSQTSARSQRGAGRVRPKPVPYIVGAALAEFADIDVAICIGASEPVSFFAYPGRPSRLLPVDCTVLQIGTDEHDLGAVLTELAEAVNAAATLPNVNAFSPVDLPPLDAKLDAASIGLVIARHLPENAILSEEILTSTSPIWDKLMAGVHPHDQLALTGGAIGTGIPLAVGAAVASPGRKVISLQADGSGLYTVQGLWTQARERLDVLTIVFANRSYAILQAEMRNVGVVSFGLNAQKMLTLDDPALDWVRLAEGFGVEAARATTVRQFSALVSQAMAKAGPFLIEAVME